MAGSETTQQMTQSIPSLAVTCHVTTDLCGGAGTQDAVKVSPVEFMRPKETKNVFCMLGGLWGNQMCEGKMALVLEPHNSVCP